jgi:hypothetical protein
MDRERERRTVVVRGRVYRQAAVMESMGIPFAGLVRRGIEAIWREQFGEEDVEAMEATGKGRVDRVYDALKERSGTDA